MYGDFLVIFNFGFLNVTLQPHTIVHPQYQNGHKKQLYIIDELYNYIGVTIALLIEQGMDGEAISLAFATTAGPECLKEVISKDRLCLKVY